MHKPGDDMWARGAAALALRDLYGAPWARTGPAQSFIDTNLDRKGSATWSGSASASSAAATSARPI